MKCITLILLILSCKLSAQRVTANAGPDTTIFFPQKEILLTGKGTGVGLKYQWDVYKVQQPKYGNDSLMTFRLYDSAIYTYRLTVTDSFGKKAYDYVNVTAKWMPMGVQNIINMESGTSKFTLLITNSGELYQGFYKQ